MEWRNLPESKKWPTDKENMLTNDAKTILSNFDLLINKKRIVDICRS